MPVDVRPQGAFGIVSVDHTHVVQAQQSIGFFKHVAQSGFIRDIETACQ